MGEAVSCLVHLNSVTLTYIGGDALGVSWVQGKSTVRNPRYKSKWCICMNQSEGLNYSLDECYSTNVYRGQISERRDFFLHYKMLQ